MFCEKSLPGIRLCVNGFWSYARLPSPLTGTITTSASCTRPRASASPTSSTSTSWSWSTTPSSTWAPEVRTAPRLSVSVLCVRLPRAQATPNPTIRWLDYIELHARRGRRQYILSVSIHTTYPSFDSLFLNLIKQTKESWALETHICIAKAPRKSNKIQKCK